MNTDMKLQKVPVEKLKPAKYNPRKDLKPGDPAYEKIKRSMTTYGYVDPVIWNEVTGNIVGGHQRYKVLVAEGVKEIDCVVVHIENPQDENALNIALNKAVGEWEPKALADLLSDLQLSGYDLGATGFDAAEVDDLFSKVHDKDVKDDEWKAEVYSCASDRQQVRWMPMDKWDECGGVVDPYQLEGRVCYAGLDLSSTSDLTALVLVFPPSNEDEPYTVMPFFWLPEETLSLRVRRDHVPYDQWAKRGFIHTTEGNVVHYGFIEQFICQLGERYNIREIAHDRWNATMMVQTLEDDGFTMVPFGQGFKDMSPPTKELMRLVLEHKLCHGGHPVLRWNMDNAYVRTDPAGNLKLDKEKSTEKVDGAVALVMALDRAMKNLNGGDSIYNHRGFIVL